MLTVVLVLNLLIAGLCWYVAWRVWQLRRALAKVTAALVVAERCTHQVLQGAPDFLMQGQTGAYQLRNQYQQVLLRLQQVKQILSLLGLGQFVWRQYFRRADFSQLDVNKPEMTYARGRSSRQRSLLMKRQKIWKARGKHF